MLKDCHRDFGAYKKRLMPQNREVVILKCFPIWKKMRRSSKKLSEIKALVHPQTLKTGSFGSPDPPPLTGC